SLPYTTLFRSLIQTWRITLTYSLHHIPQRLFQVIPAEREPGRFQPFWQRSLPAQHQHRRLTHQQTNRRCRHAQHRRAMQGMPQGVSKLFITYGVRGYHVKWPAQVVIQQPENAVDHIVDMDPRQILTTVADGPAKPHFKRRQHFTENTALRRKYHAGAQQADADTIALRRAGDALPLGAEFMGKLV